MKNVATKLNRGGSFRVLAALTAAAAGIGLWVQSAAGQRSGRIPDVSVPPWAADKVAADADKAALALAATRLAAAETAKEETNPYVWSPRVASAAVFKNGLGFFLREGEVELRDGWCVAREVPPAAFGTLAIFAYDKDYTVDVVGSGPGEVVEFDGQDAPKDLEARRARLEASKHLSVQLTYTQAKAERTAAGKLRSVGPEYVVLESDSNNFAVPLKDIVKMQILELPLRIHVNDAAGKPAAKARLGMAYLRKGVTWIPEYTLKLLDDDTAELSLRGTLVNEAEDLVHADVHLVVGVPHFIHTDYLAPIAVGQVIRSVAAATVPAGLTSQIMNRAAIVSNATFTPTDIAIQPVAPAGGEIERVVGNLPKLDGPAATDYTVYTKKDLTVRRAEKAIVTILRQKIHYSHVYRWSPPSPMEHFLVLHNATDTAFARRIFSSELTKVVLPTPGPPVITSTLLTSARLSAARWLAARDTLSFFSTHAIARSASMVDHDGGSLASARNRCAMMRSARHRCARKMQRRSPISSAVKNPLATSATTASRSVSEGISSSFSARATSSSSGKAQWPSATASVSA